MHKLYLKIGVIFIIAVFMSGCAVNRATATLDPTADLAGIKSIYVTKLAADGRGINLLITKKLTDMGYQASTGISVDIPQNANVVVTYEDRWMWDITMYMLELTVTIREPKTEFPLASGNSFHTSLTRKSPEEMVDEVINNIFSKGKRNE